MPKKHITVEISSAAHKVALAANPASPVYPGLSTELGSDVLLITQDDINKLGEVKLISMGCPCEDMSLMRLLPVRNAYDKSWAKGENPRPGLSGPKGNIFRVCLKILKWVKLNSPNLIFFVENVTFADLTEDWKEISDALGNPHVVDAQDFSCTRRRRAYWTNIVLPPDFASVPRPLDPDVCMDPGRTLQRFELKGVKYVRTIGKSWKGNPDSPTANTNAPVMVKDMQHSELQHLRPAEAERLVGMPPGCTDGPGISARQRLTCIGNGWDINVVCMFFVNYRQMLLTSGSAPPPSHGIAGIANFSQPLSQQHQLMQYALMVLKAQMTDAEFSACLASRSLPDQQLQLGLIKHWYAANPVLLASAGSVLDSGASRHLHPDTVVLDVDSKVSIEGFNGAVQWTTGNGYIPMECKDTVSGTVRPLDIGDSDSMEGLVYPLLSLGKLLRAGWEFHFTACGKTCYAVTPDSTTQLKVELGPDDLLRLLHTIRTGKSAVMLPAVPGSAGNKAWSTQYKAFVVARTLKEITAEFVHDMFLHANTERCYYTLKNTIGYKAERLPPHNCVTCAQANARRRGLSHKTHTTTANSSSSAAPAACVASSVVEQSEYGDTEDCDDSDVSDGEFTELDYTANTAGRQLGTADPPRFDIINLRPFEVMFVDNKGYPCPQRGGDKTALVLIDVKTRAKFKVDCTKKVHNGEAFAQIMVINGVHKMDYKCTVYTDGCGSMRHVASTALRMGINHQYVPPHEQSLNEAEKVCDRMWAAARVLLLHSGQSPSLMFKAVSYAMYVDMRMASGPSRGWLTPYEMIKGHPPSIEHLRPFNMLTYVTVPKRKRIKLINSGQPLLRAEKGRLIDYHSPFSTTPCIMLDGDRMVHSINVTYDVECYKTAATTRQQQALDNDHSYADIMRLLQGHPGPVSSKTNGLLEEGPTQDNPCEEDSDDDMPDLVSDADSDDDNDEPHTVKDSGRGAHWCPTGNISAIEIKGLQTHGDPFNNEEDVPQPRPRPGPDTYTEKRTNFLCGIAKLNNLRNQGEITSDEDADLLEGLCAATGSNTNESVRLNLEAGHYMALTARKDISWKEELAGPNRDLAAAAYEDEMNSLTSTILTEVHFNNAKDMHEFMAKAVPGRLILDEKRDGKMKARCVKQGFKEDKVAADGPDFNYYSHVAKLKTVRLSVLRPDRQNRRLAAIDIKTAFLQSTGYNGYVKHLVITCPITGKKRYFTQSGPIYGECSAPVRWEDTLAPWLVSIGFIRAENEACVFYHPDRDLLLVTYVDDVLIDSDEEHIMWFNIELNQRFECKEIEWLSNEHSIDFLGMDIIMDSNRIYISMENYINKMLTALEMNNLRPATCPIIEPIDGSSEPLPPHLRRKFMTGNGMLGWLVSTARPDVAFAHSRQSQHMSNPTKAAYDSMEHTCRYLKGNANLTLSVTLYNNASPISSVFAPKDQARSVYTVECYTDSDLAGNTEIQNKRRSQNGAIAVRAGAPILWLSKVTSVAFAHPLINEAHADVSSAAAEIYAASNATHEFMALSYVTEEMGMSFPLPILLGIDNTAAIAFANNSELLCEVQPETY
jgi:site-specific DNA-cytosine methylase